MGVPLWSSAAISESDWICSDLQTETLPRLRVGSILRMLAGLKGGEI
jgi:hypothetical protein